MSVCGCLCVSRIDGSSVCPLCLDTVPGEEWLNGKHRQKRMRININYFKKNTQDMTK